MHEIKKRKNNTFHLRMAALIVGLIINVIGNALTIASNMGAEPYAAAAQNLSKVLGYSVGTFLFILGIAAAIFNQCLLSKTDMSRFIGEVCYIGAFSWLVDLCLDAFSEMDIGSLNIWVRGFLSCFGVALFCSGISLYQRANILMHPNDDTSNLIRFKFLHGSAIESQLLDIVPALAIIGICWALLGTVYSINIGTLFSLICNGLLIKYSDRYFWPDLKHNHHKKHGLERRIKKWL